MDLPQTQKKLIDISDELISELEKRVYDLEQYNEELKEFKDFVKMQITYGLLNANLDTTRIKELLKDKE